MKVLQCIPSMAGGGAERQLSYLCQGLTRLGIETHVALTRRGENFERLRRSGAVIHELSVRSNHSPALPVALHRLMRRLRPQVVQTWLTQMDIVGGALARWHGVPWVATERNSAARYGRGFKDRLRLRLGRQAAALVANSTTGTAYWAPHLHPPTRLQVIPNGLPVDEIIAAPALRPAQLGTNPSEKLILFAGRLHAAKNVDGLIAALAQVRQRITFRAVLCGQGPEQPKLERLIAEYHLEGSVCLQGYAADLWSWMKSADAFVSVSFSEGQPNTVMEAMAAQCPLVVSDIPEHREFLDSTRARLVDPTNPAAMAEALVECLQNRALADERARAARQVADQWSVEATARQYRDLYEQLSSRRPFTAGRRRVTGPPSASWPDAQVTSAGQRVPPPSAATPTLVTATKQSPFTL
jgi:glycosyltransferase involved in cell wall biosynthesis